MTKKLLQKFVALSLVVIFVFQSIPDVAMAWYVSPWGSFRYSADTSYYGGYLTQVQGSYDWSPGPGDHEWYHGIPAISDSRVASENRGILHFPGSFTLPFEFGFPTRPSPTTVQVSDVSFSKDFTLGRTPRVPRDYPRDYSEHLSQYREFDNMHLTRLRLTHGVRMIDRTTVERSVTTNRLFEVYDVENSNRFSPPRNIDRTESQITSSVIRPLNDDIVYLSTPVCTIHTNSGFFRSTVSMDCFTRGISADGRIGQAHHHQSSSGCGTICSILSVLLPVLTIATPFMAPLFSAASTAVTSAVILNQIHTPVLHAVSAPGALGTVATSNSLGVGWWSWWGGFPMPPEPPTNLVVNHGNICGGSLTVTWNPVSGAVRYEVSLNGGPWVSVTTPWHIFSGLPVDSDQTVEVRAYASGLYSPVVTGSGVSSSACNELTSGDCQIPALASTCNARVSWNVTGNTRPFLIENETNNNAVIGSTATGTQMVTMLYGNNVINSFSNNVLINTINSRATCVAQHFFLDLNQTCQPNPVITITPESIWVRSGGTAEVNININAPYDLECTLEGDVSTTPSFTHSGSVNPIGDYSIDTVPISATRILSVSCDTPANDLQPPATAETRINMIPRIQEV